MLFIIILSLFTEWLVKIKGIVLIENWIVLGNGSGLKFLNVLSFSRGVDGGGVCRMYGIVIDCIYVLLMMKWYHVWWFVRYFVILLNSKFGVEQWLVFIEVAESFLFYIEFTTKGLIHLIFCLLPHNARILPQIS